MLNFVDAYVIQKVVTADNTYESAVGLSESDTNFKPSDYSGTDHFDSDDETPLSNLVKDNSSNNKNDNLNSLQSNKKRKTQLEYRWRSMKDRTSITQNVNFSDNRMSDTEKLKLVRDYFKIFFTDEMIKHIAHHTNLYSAQQNITKGSIATDKDEMERCLGILLKMSVIQAPYYRTYWENDTRYEKICAIMSRDKFELIQGYINFNDNKKDERKQDEKRDRLFKIRPLFEALRQNYLSQEPEEYTSIDEQIMPFKDRRFLRRYMPNKPHKWGFKVFSGNGASSMLYYFELKGAPDPARKEQVEELGYCRADIVMRLCSW